MSRAVGAVRGHHTRLKKRAKRQVGAVRGHYTRMKKRLEMEKEK